MSSAASGSRLATGSSASSTCGRWASARAIATALRLAAGQGAGALSGKGSETNSAQMIIGGAAFDRGQAAERRPQPAMAAEGARGDIAQHAAPPHQAGMLPDHRQRQARLTQPLAG